MAKLATTAKAVMVFFALSACGFLTPLPEPASVAERLDALKTDGLPLSAPVTIYWNDHLIPFIEASSDEDLAVALGVVHAHLRLGQMELLRRISQGRLAEIAGPLAIDIDHALRILDVGRAVPQMLDAMPPDTRVWVEAFVQGINATVAGLDELPHEFTVLGLKPEIWTAADVLTIGRLASADVNWFVWFQLLSQRGRPDWSQLWARLLEEGTASTPSYAANPSRQFALLGEILTGLSRSGSNSVAVSATRSATGGALLASDPHLGILLPSLWVLVGVKSPSYHAVGLMGPGLPFFALGRNREIAWGGTNLRAASSDLFDVSALPAGQITERTERIRVRWWFDRTVTLRDTPFGPIISDAPPIDAGETTVALRWMGHRPSDELTAMLRVNQARSWDEFRAALDGFAVSAQNMVYADARGNIGQTMAVQIPKRPPGLPADLVHPLADGAAWDTIVRGRDLPFSFNPPAGFLASANNRGAVSDIPIGYFFSPNDRVERLSAKLAGAGAVTLADLQSLQRDVFMASAAALRDTLIARMRTLPRTAAVTRAKRNLVQALREWDGQYRLDSAGAVAFEAFVFYFTQEFYDDDQLAAYGASGRPLNLIRGDVATAGDKALGAAIDLALGPAAEVLQEFPAWGDMHRMRLANPLAFLPVVGKRYVLSETPVAGGSQTLMKTAHAMTAERHNTTFGSNARHVSDLSDLDANFFVVLGGQDGRINSAAYADQLALWQRGEYIQMPLRLATVRRLFPHVTTLTP
jgi:penicillin amidase